MHPSREFAAAVLPWVLRLHGEVADCDRAGGIPRDGEPDLVLLGP